MGVNVNESNYYWTLNQGQAISKLRSAEKKQKEEIKTGMRKMSLIFGGKLTITLEAFLSVARLTKVDNCV